jgi:hypothetical protein
MGLTGAHMSRTLASTACLIAALLAVPARAETALVTAAEPEKILEIARGFGSAELTTDSSGDPQIDGRMEGKRYSVMFYGCEEGRDCRSILFWTYLTVDDPDLVRSADAWNRDNRFAKVYVDNDGDLSVEMDVNLFGGVTVANLDDTFDWWRVIIGMVRDSFGDGSTDDGTTPLKELDPHDLQRL